MPTVPNLYANVIAMVDSLVFNPSRRFLTDADYMQYMNMAAQETAQEIGLIRLVDATTATVTGQRDYILDNRYRHIFRIEYVQNLGLSTEKITPMALLTMKDKDFISHIVTPVGVSDPDSLYITGAPQPVCKYAVFTPETFMLSLYDTPSVAGDTIRIYVGALSGALAPGITYDGDAAETVALVYKFCELARLKSRETNESSTFAGKFQEACDRVRRTRSKTRRRRQVGDGRFAVNRTRSVNGEV